VRNVSHDSPLPLRMEEQVDLIDDDDAANSGQRGYTLSPRVSGSSRLARSRSILIRFETLASCNIRSQTQPM